MLYYSISKSYEEKQNEKVKKIEKFFGKDVISIAQECGFPYYTTLILKNDEKGLKDRFRNIYNNIMSCHYAADNRTPMEYAKDLVLAWIFEAYVMENLKKQGLKVERNGGDKNLLILNQRGVSIDSDFLVEGRRVELISNYTNYWEKNSCFELRDNKVDHLRDSKSLVIGVSTNYSNYLLIDFSKEIEDEYIASYSPFGNKPAHRIKIVDDMKVELDFGKLAIAIREKINHK